MTAFSQRAPTPAPIPALIDYYHRLREDPNETIAPFGFSVQQISFRVVIEPDGSLHAIQDARVQSGRRLVPTAMIVPGQSKPAGQGINPRFLWDNAQYMLGVKQDDANPDRTAKAFSAFKQRHLDLMGQIGDEQFSSVCRFLEHWNPAEAAEANGYKLLEEVAGGFGVFQLRGQTGYVHQQPAVQQYWQQQIDAELTPPEHGDAEATGQSLISGRTDTIARLHEPKIKGVAGGQSTGGVLVGFNEDAYTSYGKFQAFNAPIADHEAFRYCTALNQLLARHNHRARLADMTVVFWSERKSDFESVAAFFLGGDTPADDEAEDTQTTERVRGFIEALHRGVPHGGLADAETPFYILGLSPNAARISVRFWLADTIGAFADQLTRHVRNLQIVGDRENEPPTIRRLLLETARDARDIPPQLGGEVTRAVLTGTRYPQMLYTAVLRRVRADHTMNRRRAAILKACLIRNYEKEVSVSLNQDHPDPAYHMGRLFAALEKTQQDALGQQLNRTIKDGYFATASATPAAVFPRLIRMHQHHIEKLEGGLKVSREQKIQEICGHLDRFPTHLPLNKQGLFHIGYYHQRQHFFTKGESNQDFTETATASEETTDA